MRKVKMFFASVRDDLKNGENLDAYLLIILGLFFATLDILGVVDFNIIGPVILMTLSLLVIGDLVNRHNYRDLRNILTANNRANASSPLKPYALPDDTLVTRLKTAQETSLLGTSLHRFIPYQRNAIEGSLTAGGRLRVIITNPKNEGAMQMAALASEDRVSAATQQQRILTTVDELKNLKRRYPNGDIQLKTIDYIPPFGMTLILSRGSQSDKWCHVRLQGFRKAVSDSPVINPDVIVHDELFRFYREQFDLMWDAGTDIPLEPTA